MKKFRVKKLRRQRVSRVLVFVGGLTRRVPLTLQRLVSISVLRCLRDLGRSKRGGERRGEDRRRGYLKRVGVVLCGGNESGLWVCVTEVCWEFFVGVRD